MPIVMTMIEQLETFTSLKGINISMDRLYTSVDLFEWLLKRNITAIGTIMANRKCIPPQIKSVLNRSENSYVVLWENEHKKMSIHSYVVNTKSSGRKNVLVLATVPPLLGVTKDNKKKTCYVEVV